MELNLNTDNDRRTILGRKLLLLAIRGQHLKAVKKLLAHGVGNNFVNAVDGKALFIASSITNDGTSSSLEIMKELVNHGADIATHYERCLTSASAAGNLEVVKFILDQQKLLTKKDDKQSSDDTLWLAIKYAQDNGHLNVLKLLFKEVKIDDNMKRNDRLLSVTAAGNLEYVKRLLNEGADIHTSIEVTYN